MQENWKELSKSNCRYHYNLKLNVKNVSRLIQVAFDSSGKTLITVDSKGYAYVIDLIGLNFNYKEIGHVGSCNFVEFNPINKGEILIGQNSKDIKITAIDNVSSYCSLPGHTAPPKRATFYKEFCMTVSNNEAIIWYLQTYSKAHHLKLFSDSLLIKTAAFSNSGLVAILYKNNIIQCWAFKKFETTIKLNLNDFGLRNVQDFAFSKDGKIMIIGGNESKLVAFSTQSWEVIKNISHGKNSSGINKLMVVERPFNYVIATLLSNRSLEFFDISTTSFIRHCGCKALKMVKRVDVSQNGRYVAHVRTDGELVVTLLDEMLSKKPNAPKNKEPQTYAHCAEDHLQCVQMAAKEELKLERLLPILKEFGEYPERHRTLIWSTVMNLPSNKEAYLALNKTVTEGADGNSIKNYSLADKSKATLLGTITSCLIHWCSLLEHSDFIPELVFPFVVVFQKNPILAFEASLIIILNFCQKWFEYHPLPPLNVLGIVENILLEADPQLLSFFCDRGITSTDYAWPLLRTTFSEVLPATEWLILWDHLLSYDKPSLFLSCVVAYSVCSREVIINNLKTPEDIQRFYSSQSHMQAKKLLRIAQNLDKLMPPRIHPKQYIRNYIQPIPICEVYPPLPQLEYPKILAEDFQAECTKKKLREKEIMEKERNHAAAQLAENRRLHMESENFKKQIHKVRMEELRKCYEQLQTQDTDSEKVDVIWDSCDQVKTPQKIVSSNKRVRPQKTQSKFCKEMQKQVERLEHEICNLLSKDRK